MPLTEAERAFLEEPPSSVDAQHQVLEHTPSSRLKIGKWTIVALILNRTIGSGIFLTPNKILAGTGCVGGALCLWALGALISFCGLYVWLECGLSMPQRLVRGETEPRGVPRSGGEKNFLEFMFPSPKFRTTCCFAIMFILLYNLSGNALSFGIQVMIASGKYRPQDSLQIPPPPPHQGTTIGIAIVALTAAILLHVFSRRGGILVNNAFAIVKVLLLVVIVCLGIAKAGGAFGGNGGVPYSNFTRDVFITQRRDIASWSDSLIYCMYTFSGFEQPFYVLAETKSPRRYFPRYTVLAMIFAVVLFMLVNISYLLVVPKEDVLNNIQIDLATLFFDRLFEGHDERATRALAGLIAFSILGNIVVMTFTASRVKQEIAKEGILPFSLTIATSHTTPYGLLRKARNDTRIANEHVEQSPVVAFGLHWFTSVLLILVTIPIRDVRTAYAVLVSLYSYTIILVSGCWVSVGLIMVKLRKEKFKWQTRRRYRPWLSPVHAIIYACTCALLLVAAFMPPAPGSPYHSDVTKFQWYIVPTIGLSAPLWGYIWYLGLLAYQRKAHRYLHVERTPFWIKDPDCPGEFVQRAEIIDHTMRPRGRGDIEMVEGFADDQQSLGSNSDDVLASTTPKGRSWWRKSPGKNNKREVQVFSATFEDDEDDSNARR